MAVTESKKRSRALSESSSVTPDAAHNADRHMHKRQNVGDLALPLKPTSSVESIDSRSSSTTAVNITTPTAPLIHMRTLIVTQDASIIIGKGGSHVSEIRDQSGARVAVSDAVVGNPERVLTVSGPLDAVSKAFGLIVRRINDEPFDQPSVPGSRAVTMKLLIPNSRMGSVIGKAGIKIREIQEASGARLNASEGVLPGSSERVLSVAGVADAIHIATYHVGEILLESQSSQKEVFPNANYNSYRPAPQNLASRPPPQPPQPQMNSHGYHNYTQPQQQQYPHPHPYQQHQPPHLHPYPHHAQQRPGFANLAQPNTPSPYPPTHIAPAPPPHSHSQQPAQPLVHSLQQEIFVPNDLVGCIIGKGGSKINEIRQQSQTQIKIMEPGVTSGGVRAAGGTTDRLITVYGQHANVQMAVSLLVQRIEQEKRKQATSGMGAQS
ncbi:hypothetical protein BKA62DRAFT_695361 [Auriculariales sp. MPI-PUGE-AT-0066]|nr:hypothetical protein BKA62DRAFT_695361 [Auriculariales sp. MPI-PUGE-AT-0066]